MFESIPDIANSHYRNGPSLDRVGMEGIEIPVRFASRKQGGSLPITTLARADVYVNLIDPNSKGIHMSRLFLIVEEVLRDEELNFASLRKVLERFSQSHAQLSDSSYLRIAFDLPVKRKALLSDHGGWRSYPIVFEADLIKNQFDARVEFKVLYSSTCPCSAALARQVIQGSFYRKFGDKENASTREVIDWLGTEAGVGATPHGQRSQATVQLKLETDPADGIESLIDAVETALGTPVQAAVKREDEQEFARLNGQNLMFAEDAARKIKSMLAARKDVKDFSVKVEHFESLHPHNAVAYARRS